MNQQQKPSFFSKKKLLFGFFLLFLLAVGFLLWALLSSDNRFFQKQSPVSTTENIKQQYLTVFIHGTFGTSLGMLSMFDVLKDDVKDTFYKKVAKKMRDDHRFYYDQPLLERGLVKITPSFDLTATNGKKYAAYPIIKSFDLVHNSTGPHNQTHHFYTFGWGGLISQQCRRLEAVRLYNALSDELRFYHKQGIYPQIRLICHSHAGNLAFNIAAINETISWANKSVTPQSLHEYGNENTRESLLNMLAYLKNLPPEKVARKKKQSKKALDFLPNYPHITIDELILLGTPIQPETEGLCFATTFGHIYNFYSDEDVIQKLDWISTKRSYSEQRLNHNNSNPKKESPLVIPVQKPASSGSQVVQYAPITQAKIMVNHTLSTSGYHDPTTTKENAVEVNSLWNTLFATFSAKKTNDPTHKELWFLSWNRQTYEPLHPLPMVIFMPLFLKALQKNKALNDIDLNIKSDDKTVTLEVAYHNNPFILNRLYLPFSLVEEMKEQIKLWRPNNWSKEGVFNIINSMLTGV